MAVIMADMARPSTFALHDRVLGGGLADLLRQWRSDGVSFTEMSFRLREKNVHVSPETLRRWMRILDAEQSSPERVVGE